jgi:hypothetical protein
MSQIQGFTLFSLTNIEYDITLEKEIFITPTSNVLIKEKSKDYVAVYAG